MCDLGEFEPVSLREIWPNEANNFTPWLAKNIEILSDALRLQLEVISREASVGEFSLDLLVRDVDSSRTGIIENQYNQTDHAHFGQLLTYAGGLDASIVIWISEHVREEHRAALDWLNRTNTETQFFAVEVEVLRIDDSRPAPIFRPVVFPNEWRRATRRNTSTNTSPRNEKYRLYFQGLIDELREHHRFTNARVGLAQPLYDFPSGISGIKYYASFRENNRVCTSIWINWGSREENLQILNALMERRTEIESNFGKGLIWERKDGKSQEISVCRDGNIDLPDSELEEFRTWHSENLRRLKTAFDQHIRSALDAINNNEL